MKKTAYDNTNYNGSVEERLEIEPFLKFKYSGGTYGVSLYRFFIKI